MSILAINSGSSSVKYQLYDWDQQRVVADGLIDRIGLKNSCPDHKTALKMILKDLKQETIEAVGHRVVHGGEKFSRSVLINKKVLAAIKANIVLAPLHNPPNIIGIEAALEVLPNIKHVAVFDTAFHQTMPAYAYTYAVDPGYLKKYGVRRYGFHGSSHRYITEKTQELLNKKEINLISIHVGNGVSLAAIKKGVCVDTSMGMTPLSGVVMGTRSGDFDPAIVPYLMEHTGKSGAEICDILNKKSGMFGLTGKYSDQRDIEKGVGNGDERCKLAVAVQAYSIKKYLGAYLAILGQTDAIVFTAGIGENLPVVRTRICNDLEELGIKLDAAKNDIALCYKEKKPYLISADDSKIKVYVIPTNEEYILARDVIELVRDQ